MKTQRIKIFIQYFNEWIDYIYLISIRYFHLSYIPFKIDFKIILLWKTNIIQVNYWKFKLNLNKSWHNTFMYWFQILIIHVLISASGIKIIFEYACITIFMGNFVLFYIYLKHSNYLKTKHWFICKTMPENYACYF